jgi:hypothetical protein
VHRPLLRWAEPLRPSPRHGRVEPPPAPFPITEPFPNQLTRPPRCCPHCPSIGTGRELAGAEGAAAGTSRRSRSTRRHHHRPELRLESSLRTPSGPLRPRPVGPGRRFTGIWPDRRRPAPGDPIARSRFFMRV